MKNYLCLIVALIALPVYAQKPINPTDDEQIRAVLRSVPPSQLAKPKPHVLRQLQDTKPYPWLAAHPATPARKPKKKGA